MDTHFVVAIPIVGFEEIGPLWCEGMENSHGGNDWVNNEIVSPHSRATAIPGLPGQVAVRVFWSIPGRLFLTAGTAECYDWNPVHFFFPFSFKSNCQVFLQIPPCSSPSVFLAFASSSRSWLRRETLCVFLSWNPLRILIIRPLFNN